MKRTLSLLLAALLLLALALPAAAAEDVPPVTTRAQLIYIQKHGNVILDLPAAELDALGYRFGDVLTLRLPDREVTLPYCDSYGCVDAGQPVLAARSGLLLAAINMGDFASTCGVADKERAEDGSITWSRADGAEAVEITISMAEPGAYAEQYALRSLQYSDERADYPALTDAQFANFRAVRTTGMGANRLYRSASPVNPQHGRSGFADAAMADAGVTVVLNLVDTPAECAAFDGYADSYCAGVTTVFAPMGFDLTDADNRGALAQGLRALAAQPGVYAVHCLEGKDRAGVVTALLECLMGATAQELAADYMETYANYYGLAPADARYPILLENGLLQPLGAALGVAIADTSDLAAAAARYLSDIGLSEAEIAQLKAHLAASRPFADVSDADAPAVEAVRGALWMSGTDETHFSPAAPLTRAQLAAVLWRAAGQPVVDYILPFADVPGDVWYAEAVRWAAAERITEGVAPGCFAPDAAVTREQLAAMLYRYERARGGGFTGLWSFPLSYGDAAEIADWAFEPVCWLTMHGVTEGADGLFAPKAAVRRGEAAAILARWKDAA